MRCDEICRVLKLKEMLIIVTAVVIVIAAWIICNVVKYDSYVLDGKTYVVMRTPHSAETASILHIVHEQLERIVNYSNDAHLKRVFRAVKFSDHVPDAATRFVAYNRNKQHISLCTHFESQPNDMRTLMYIAVHELAHCAMRDFEATDPRDGATIHSQTFTDTANDLYRIATHLGIDYNGNVTGVRFCGQKL